LGVAHGGVVSLYGPFRRRVCDFRARHGGNSFLGLSHDGLVGRPDGDTDGGMDGGVDLPYSLDQKVSMCVFRNQQTERALIEM
jgi:hypothetical protein